MPQSDPCQISASMTYVTAQVWLTKIKTLPPAIQQSKMGHDNSGQLIVDVCRSRTNLTRAVEHLLQLDPRWGLADFAATAGNAGHSAEALIPEHNLFSDGLVDTDAMQQLERELWHATHGL